MFLCTYSTAALRFREEWLERTTEVMRHLYACNRFCLTADDDVIGLNLSSFPLKAWTEFDKNTNK